MKFPRLSRKLGVKNGESPPASNSGPKLRIIRLQVSVPYPMGSPSSSVVTANTTLKPAQTSLPLQAPSDLFVNQHQTLVHSPLGVAQPVVVDPQPVSTALNTGIRKNLWSIRYARAFFYPACVFLIKLHHGNLS